MANLYIRQNDYFSLLLESCVIILSNCEVVEHAGLFSGSYAFGGFRALWNHLAAGLFGLV